MSMTRKIYSCFSECVPISANSINQLKAATNMPYVITLQKNIRATEAIQLYPKISTKPRRLISEQIAVQSTIAHLGIPDALFITTPHRF